ncbi:MAG: enterotoxin [Pedosphaera sp.]|nr:enterotoxin [Pedosphaera sp.]
MKNTLMIVALLLVSTLVCRAQDSGKLENSAIAWQWYLASGKLTSTLKDKADGTVLNIQSECFQLVLGDGRTIKASELKLVGVPRTDELPADPASPTLARHFTGHQLTLIFADEPDHLTAIWQAELREGANYLQQQLTLRATGGDVLIKEITLFDQPVAGAKTIGTVDGSPVVAGTFFCGYEHPMAQNTVAADHDVQCRLTRNAVLKDGETLVQRFVLGVAVPGQMRRAFLAYIESARAHPYRPFLHYNSWFDIAWDKQKFNEAQSLDAIQQFGVQLVQQRGVQMDSYLFDDGWDDNKSLWKFHAGFPNGFTPLKAETAKYHVGIGVWVSPFGGYDVAKIQRLKYASQFGYETNASGFSLAGPKYYQRFHDICLEMVQKYGVNQFKFDGLAAGARANETGLMRDGDAMLRLVEDLRAAKPDIYINLTTGTWPSPFWLLGGDSTWRGGADHDFYGKGSARQRWLTYRDKETYDNVVQRGPLYPLNSLMLHGIIYATNASQLNVTTDADFADEVREFFGNGTQLQELYITPKLMNAQNWDDLAEAAKWSRANADVLVDTHWIGGDPGKNEVYGWASWSPRKGIIVLRNPNDQPANFTADAATLFELPAGATGKFVMQSPWQKDHELPPTTLESGQPHMFTLKPFEVLVLESTTQK